MKLRIFFAFLVLAGFSFCDGYVAYENNWNGQNAYTMDGLEARAFLLSSMVFWKEYCNIPLEDDRDIHFFAAENAIFPSPAEGDENGQYYVLLPGVESCSLAILTTPCDFSPGATMLALCSIKRAEASNYSTPQYF